VGVLYPLFGPMAAIGLVQLADELKTMPDVEVATYLHQSWKALVDDINRQPKGTRILIVGYSLGANNAVLVANNTSYVDSIVALQPSMLTSQESLTGKVGKIIEIYNPNRWMTFGGMGSQKLDAPNIFAVCAMAGAAMDTGPNTSGNVISALANTCLASFVMRTPP
jgi:hypothetical protein